MSHLAPSYFPSLAHEEALARLDYLVTSQRRVGVLLGGAGSGKSFALAQAARLWRRENHAVALVDGAAIEADTLLWQIAGDWQNAVALRSSRAALWQAVTDALAVHRCEARASVLLVDNAGQATFDVLDIVARLAQAGDILQPRLTIVLATEAPYVTQLGAALLSRAELRIELAPLDAAETRDFLTSQWPAEDASAPRIDLDATIRLHDLTAGLPRRLNQLANLVKLAAAGDGREEIDAALVDSVYRELSTQPLAR